MIVFHIVTNFDLGGSERVAINIAKSKNDIIKYHIIEVCQGNSSFSKELIKEIESENIRVHKSLVKNHKLGIVIFPFKLFILALKYNPKVIHSHAEIADLSTYIFHTLFQFFFPQIKYVRTIHST